MTNQEGIFVNKIELDNFLTRFTDSEIKHQTENHPITHRYENIKKKEAPQGTIYIFNYHSLLEKSNIAIMKNSRFMSVPLHIHSVIEMNYVFSGECCQKINGTTLYMKKGDVCILDTNVPHEINKLGKDDIVLNIIMSKEYFTNNFLNRWSQNNVLTNFLVNALDSEQVQSSYLYFESSSNEALQDYIIKLCCEYYDPQLCSQEIINSLMILIFSELIRVYSDNRANSYLEKNDVIKIFRYIEENYKSCSLESISNEFSFHPNYMSQFIKKNTGHTFKELLIQQRISEACLLLRHSDKTISDISRTVGYENTGFFYKKFMKLMKVDPKTYKEQNGWQH